MDNKGDESEVQDNDQFYKTGLEVGLSPGDAGGPQADFFERFLKNHSEVNDDRIRTVRQSYFFTSRLHGRAQRKSKKSKCAHNLLTTRYRKMLGLFDVATGDVKYDTFSKVHNIWKTYFREAVGIEHSDNLLSLQTSLMKADYTGCHFVIAASKCSSLVGMKGFVVQETKNCFRLITDTERVVSVPKKGSLFAFTLDDKLFKIYGSHFRKHGFERGKMKFKVTENVTL